MPIPSWSHSRVITFEQCKFRAHLLHDLKIPEPERPLPKGKTEHANDRGTRVHNDCELYVRGDLAQPPAEACKFFRPEMERMRELYEHGRVQLEGEWGMNSKWEPTGWRGQWIDVTGTELVPKATTVLKKLPEHGKDGDFVRVGKSTFMWEPAWLRLKLDALVFVNDTEAIAIDYKTGRKQYNEVKHGEQLQLYQLVTFLRYPQLEMVHTELWYFDVDELTSMSFTRTRGLMYKQKWDKRGSAVTTAQDFPPNPNPVSCKWCQYGPWNGGQCSVGVRAP
jgi:hypothetical protein